MSETLKTVALHGLTTVTMLGGIGLIGFGFWQWYPPAGYVMVGALLFAISLPDA